MGGMPNARDFCLEASLKAKYADAAAGMRYQARPHNMVGAQERKSVSCGVFMDKENIFIFNRSPGAC
jgi:hypothetical protein